MSPYTCGTLGDNFKNTSRIRRIVGGITSSYGAWPWLVAISYTSTSKYNTVEAAEIIRKIPAYENRN